jgi:anti-sigma-K factor RskA
MIDDRLEELAALHALDLLEGQELAHFETALTDHPELLSFVRELREATSALARTAPAATPPPELRQRVLASIDTIRSDVPVRRAAEADRPAPDNVVDFPALRFWRVLPWAAAACFALGAVWLGQLYLAAQNEVALLRQQSALAEISLKSVRQEYEAERILARTRVAGLDRDLASAGTALATAQSGLASARTELASARTTLAERDTQLAALTRRYDAVAGASAELGRQLGESRTQVAKLTDDLRYQGELAGLKITALASLLNNSPKALAVAVWDPKKQEGVLKVEKLPALLPSQDYQLWVVDPQYPNPVDGGVFTVDPETGDARILIKAKQPVAAVNAFAVTLERKGGVPKAEGPFVLLGK